MPLIKRILFILFAFVFSKGIASPQMPDYIIFKNDTISTYNLLVEDYLQKLPNDTTKRLFGLSFRDNVSFNCWRGYQAIYKVENDSLFLVDMINCGELRNTLINKEQSFQKLKSVFGDRLKNGKIHVDWLQGI